MKIDFYTTSSRFNPKKESNNNKTYAHPNLNPSKNKWIKGSIILVRVSNGTDYIIKILENGKGILAADESTGTMTKRLDGVGVPSTPENRLLFRETLFCSSEMKNCIGGVILYDETIKQTSSKKNKIPELIESMGSCACLLYTSPSPRDMRRSRMPSSA